MGLPAERGNGQDMALIAWSAAYLRQGTLVEAAIAHLPSASVPLLQSVDLCNLLWAVAHMNVAVDPDLLLRFSVGAPARACRQRCRAALARSSGRCRLRRPGSPPITATWLGASVPAGHVLKHHHRAGAPGRAAGHADAA